jgi:hypothetical protein
MKRSWRSIFVDSLRIWPVSLGKVQRWLSFFSIRWQLIIMSWVRRWLLFLLSSASVDIRVVVSVERVLHKIITSWLEKSERTNKREKEKRSRLSYFFFAIPINRRRWLRNRFRGTLAFWSFLSFSCVEGCRDVLQGCHCDWMCEYNKRSGPSHS